MKEKIAISDNMLQYNKEFIGTQNAILKYKNKEIVFKLTILPQKLDTPNISYLDNKIIWSSVKNATKYQLIINSNEIEVTTNEFSFNDYELGPGILNIKVKAQTTSEKYTDSEFSNSLELSKLEPISDILYTDGKLQWKSVEGAEHYSVWINDTEYNSNTNELPFADFVIGRNLVKVAAVSTCDNVVSGSLQEKIFYKLLVKDISYNSGKIHWYSSSEKCKYKITIDGELFETPVNYYTYPLLNDITYNVSVQALPLDENSIESSITTATIIYKKLEKPKISILFGNYKKSYIVKVEDVKKADSYKIKITLHTGEQTLTKDYTICSSEKEFQISNDVTKITVEVTAIDSTGEYADSDITVTEKVIY